MPAGSGPVVSYVTAFTMPADTSEHVVCILPVSNWNSPLGNLMAFAVLLIGAATGTVTFRIRQGTAITGTQVGSSVVVSTASGQVNTPGIGFADTSAFGLAQQGGQYVLTAQGSVNSVATLTTALLELETIAPVI
jgi:hypothetical protein